MTASPSTVSSTVVIDQAAQAVQDAEQVAATLNPNLGPGIVAMAGAEALIFLLVGYILYEMGRKMLKNVHAGTTSPLKAKLIFGFPTLLLSLAPTIITGLIIRDQLFGSHFDMLSGVKAILTCLITGFIAQAGCLIYFFNKVEKAEKERQK